MIVSQHSNYAQVVIQTLYFILSALEIYFAF